MPTRPQTRRVVQARAGAVPDGVEVLRLHRRAPPGLAGRSAPPWRRPRRGDPSAPDGGLRPVQMRPADVRGLGRDLARLLGGLQEVQEQLHDGGADGEDKVQAHGEPPGSMAGGGGGTLVAACRTTSTRRTSRRIDPPGHAWIGTPSRPHRAHKPLVEPLAAADLPGDLRGQRAEMVRRRLFDPGDDHAVAQRSRQRGGGVGRAQERDAGQVDGSARKFDGQDVAVSGSHYRARRRATCQSWSHGTRPPSRLLRDGKKGPRLELDEAGRHEVS